MSWTIECRVMIAGIIYRFMIAHFAMGWLPYVDIVGINDVLRQIKKSEERRIISANIKHKNNRGKKIRTPKSCFLNLFQNKWKAMKLFLQNIEILLPDNYVPMEDYEQNKRNFISFLEYEQLLDKKDINFLDYYSTTFRICEQNKLDVNNKDISGFLEKENQCFTKNIEQIKFFNKICLEEKCKFDNEMLFEMINNLESLGATFYHDNSQGDESIEYINASDVISCLTRSETDYQQMKPIAFYRQYKISPSRGPIDKFIHYANHTNFS